MKLFALFTLGVIALTAASSTTEAPANVSTTAAPANANTTEASANANTTEASNNANVNTTTAPASNTTEASNNANVNTTAAPASNVNTTEAPANGTATDAPTNGTATDAATDAPTNGTATDAPTNGTATDAPTDAATTVAFVAGNDLKVEIVSSIGFAEALNETMQGVVEVAFCAQVKSTLATLTLGASAVVPTCTISQSARRRLLAVSYDLKAEATVPAASALAASAISAGLDGAITLLNTKLLADTTLKAANGNVAPTVTTVKSLTSVPASTTVAPTNILESGTGRACMVPSAIVFVLASSLFN